MKKISVIILNWNGTKLLRKYLPTVVANSKSELAEVIVADNGSTDDSLKVMREEFSTVRLITFNKNYGFAKGYNLAIDQIDTPYVILLNDDVRVSPEWLEPLYDFMESHPEVGAVQPKLLSDRDPEYFEYAGAAGGFLDKNGYPYCRGRIFNTVEKDEGQYDNEAEIMWATGACLMIRTELYKSAGGLDNDFFAHMEEIDLCWRVRNLGYKLYCIPSSVVYHYGGASLAMGNPQKTKLNFRNSLLMLYKNLPAVKRNLKVHKRMILDGLAAANFLAHGEVEHVKAIWKAHKEARHMIRHIYYDNRKAHGLKIKPQNPQALYREEKLNILIHYYLLRHKKYSDL